MRGRARSAAEVSKRVRDGIMWTLRQRGETYTSIARAFGLSAIQVKTRIAGVAWRIASATWKTAGLDADVCARLMSAGAIPSRLASLDIADDLRRLPIDGDDS